MHKLDKTIKSGIFIFAILLISACTSSLVIGTVYNDAANRLAKQIKSYATFSESQNTFIDTNFEHYHSWHRTTQLPLYSQLLTDISQHLEQGSPVTRKTVNDWLAQIDHYSKALRRCNPLNDSTDFLVNLSDKQVQQIGDNINHAQIRQSEKYTDQTNNKRRQIRHKEISKVYKRAGLKLNKQQSELLFSTLEKQFSLGTQRHFIWEQWADQFIAFLEVRQQKDFSDNMNKHIATLWDLTEKSYPQQWQHNSELWSGFLHQYVQLQTTSQKRKLVRKISDFSKIIDKLSRKNPISKNPRCYATGS